MKIYFSSKRRIFMTSSGVQLDKYGRYIVPYLSYVKLYGIEIFGMFIGVIRNAR